MKRNTCYVLPATQAIISVPSASSVHYGGCCFSVSLFGANSGPCLGVNMFHFTAAYILPQARVDSQVVLNPTDVRLVSCVSEIR